MPRRKIRVVYEPLDELAQRGRADNPKQHAAEAIEGSIAAVGYVEPVVVNERDGQILSGHGRVAALVAMKEQDDAAPDGVTVDRASGWKVPVVRGVDLSEEEAQRYVIAANQTTIAGGWQDDRLEAMLANLADSELGLAGTGFLDDDLAALRVALREGEAQGGLTDPDGAPPAPDEPYVMRGQLYALGAHRLLCGDATDADDVERLLDRAVPLLMVTDPPYGVDYDPEWRDQVNYAPKRRRGRTAGDDRVNWREAWEVSPSGVAYVWHADRHASEVQKSLEAERFEIRCQVIWAKPQHSFGRGHYHWQHEPCWYAVRKGAQAHWSGGRKETTLWEIEPVRANRPADGADEPSSHGAQKPVECMERPIRNHDGDVYDPFVGSGTTIIAAERLGRTCYAMDIDPAYIQVALERWEAYTGQKAELVEDAS